MTRCSVVGLLDHSHTDCVSVGWMLSIADIRGA